MKRFEFTSTMAPITVPMDFTIMEEKRILFSMDCYYKESWEDFARIWDTDCKELMKKVGLVIFKPDAFVSRNVDEILNYICKLGFYPISYMSFRYSRHMIRDFWRYQFNTFTRQCVDILDDIYTFSDSLCVLFYTNKDFEYPTSEILSELKGPSDPLERKSYHIRSKSNVSSRILNSIHTSDEPADVIRDIGVCFNDDERSRLLQMAYDFKNVKINLKKYINKMYEKITYKNLSYTDSLSKIMLEIQKETNFEGKDYIRRYVDRELHIEQVSWTVLKKIIKNKDLYIDLWDLILVISEIIETKYSTVDRIFPEQRSLYFYVKLMGVLKY